MTPNELYALPPISVEAWHDCHNEVVEEVLQLDGLDHGYEQIEDNDEGRLVVHKKLHHNVDGERGVTFYALYFDNDPFALMFTGGRGGRDARDSYVTNAAAWKMARAYALEYINRSVGPEDRVTPGDEELASQYYGASVVRFGDEVRLVASDEASPFSGNPVYDMKKFEATFDAVIRPLGKEIGYEGGLSDPRMMEAGLKAFRSGVLGDMVELDIDLGRGDRIVAASEVDGHTFAYVANTNGRYFTWAREITPHMVGPASMLECYADYAAGRPISPDCHYVREAAEAFGAEPEAVHRELLDFLAAGGRSMAERIVETMPRDERVPERLTHGYASFAIAHMLLDNPDLRRFCSGGYPSHKKAQELVDLARELDEGIASGEIKAPAP